ncbi:hypothetical protein POSPLADRAFT_1158045 [Postia placenta MAD-698-R-SB12]|uniref:Uncharacterized protein n=1 Tax=Postia placenta MAD-698-R-SB12 TaxID=670580 RepID=A0A1X6MKH8_9APHY|nr:hypothetical protein POSPLADRAFT_1158045 [Postia placenta MAD-698-R-SB12]OSX56927.1 hypothetical protein POSPLADRAFT_1158045 [Postia placenta MAD-698-R-SB12]
MQSQQQGAQARDAAYPAAVLATWTANARGKLAGNRVNRRGGHGLLKQLAAIDISAARGCGTVGQRGYTLGWTRCGLCQRCHSIGGGKKTGATQPPEVHPVSCPRRATTLTGTARAPAMCQRVGAKRADRAVQTLSAPGIRAHRMEAGGRMAAREERTMGGET